MINTISIEILRLQGRHVMLMAGSIHSKTSFKGHYLSLKILLQISSTYINKAECHECLLHYSSLSYKYIQYILRYCHCRQPFCLLNYNKFVWFAAHSLSHYILISLFAITIAYPSPHTRTHISPVIHWEEHTVILFIPSLSFGRPAALCSRLQPKMNVCPVTALASCCRCLSGPIDSRQANFSSSSHTHTNTHCGNHWNGFKATKHGLVHANTAL